MDDLVDGLFYSDIGARFESFSKPSVLTWYSDETLGKTLLLVLRNLSDINGLCSYVVWQVFDVIPTFFQISSQPEGQPVALTAKYKRACVITYWKGREEDRFRLPALSYNPIKTNLSNESEIVLPPTHRLFNSSRDFDKAIESLSIYLKSFYPAETGWRFVYATPPMISKMAENQEFLELITGYINGNSKGSNESGHGDVSAGKCEKPAVDL